MKYTTLSKLKEHYPCEGGWKTLLEALGPRYPRTKPISLLRILDSNGLDDALWALRSIDDDKFCRLLACDFADRVLPIFEKKYPKDSRPRACLEVARRLAIGEAARAELDAARDAAGDAAWDAVGAAAGDAAWAAARAAARAAAWDAAGAAAWDAAGAAAWAAARAAEREWQESHFRALLGPEEAGPPFSFLPQITPRETK